MMNASKWTVLATQFAKLPNDITLRCHESPRYRLWKVSTSHSQPFDMLATRAGEALGGNRDHWFNKLIEQFPEAVDYLGECPMPPYGRHTVFYIHDAAGLSRMLAAELAGQADDATVRHEHNPEDGNGSGQRTTGEVADTRPDTKQETDKSSQRHKWDGTALDAARAVKADRDNGSQPSLNEFCRHDADERKINCTGATLEKKLSYHRDQWDPDGKYGRPKGNISDTK